MTEEVIPLEEIGKWGTVKVYNQAYVDKLEGQLEQAKEIINLFIQWNYGCCDIPDYKSIVKYAEQFLKE